VAIEADNLELVDVLLRAGADPARINSYGYTALFKAAHCGHLEIVRYLLQHHPELLNVRNHGHTPIFNALANDNFDVASALLDAGADHTINDEYDTTTLLACSDVSLSERLLDLGVDVNAKDSDGFDAFISACACGRVELAMLLLSRGADLYTRSSSNETALISACTRGHLEIVSLLLSKKPMDTAAMAEWMAWLNAPDEYGDTALHLAIEENRDDIVRALVDAGCDVNIRNNKGAPALHYVKDTYIARILLDAGAEDLVCNDGHTAAFRACERRGHGYVLRLLLQRFPDSQDPDLPLLFTAASNGAYDAVDALLETHPENINKRDSKGCTALHHTVDPETVWSFLRRVSAVSDLVAARDLKGRTAMMHQCCSVEQSKALGLVLAYCEDHGIDARVNNKDNNGDTALHIAMLGCCEPTVELLLENGAEVLGSGYGDTTVLMKPFLGDDDVSTLSEGLNNRIRCRSDRSRDSCANSCLVTVLDHVVKFGTGTNGGFGDENEEMGGGAADDVMADEEADVDGEHPAKRRRAA
jgi:ankyrin repeat protein